jgi:Flp pilus assembly protein TadG
MRDRTGSSAVEFALVFPVLATILFAIIKFGLALNNYVELTNGVRAGARQFAVGRSSATVWTDTRNRIFVSAPNLTQGNVTITMNVVGAPCTTDAGCQTQLAANPGNAATIIASYPCDLAIMGVNFAPGCTLRSQTTERIE